MDVSDTAASRSSNPVGVGRAAEVVHRSEAATGTSPFDQTDLAAVDGLDGLALERRGRAWLLWSFLLCPCHLPWTLAILATVFGSTWIGVAVRDHVWIAGILITAAWVLGTGYGFRLIRRAERAGGACSTRPKGAR